MRAMCREAAHGARAEGVPEGRLRTKCGPCAESAAVAGMRRMVAHAVRAAHAQVAI